MPTLPPLVYHWLALPACSERLLTSEVEPTLFGAGQGLPSQPGFEPRETIAPRPLYDHISRKLLPLPPNLLRRRGCRAGGAEVVRASN